MKLSRLIIVIMIIIVLAISVFYVFLQSSVTISYHSQAELSGYVTEYPTNAATTEPNGIAVDSHGNVWFTLENRSSLGELTAATGVIHEFPIPTHLNGGTTTWGIVVDNSRNLVWFTEQNSNSIWSFNISSHKFTRYELQNASSFPFGITLDSKGNVWFTEFFNNDIGEITLSGKMTEIPVPLRGYLEISSIAVNSSGGVWFTIPGIDFIGSYYNDQFTFRNLTGLAELPVGIPIDKRGNIWMTEHGPSFIAEFNPTTTYFKTISTTVPNVL
ncbi:MAG: SMP-30/gluconolactonase/LRE family protein, partial [Nitrososphaerota archaeon]|nr:SMP-30/gluconolactonase/LRE family protein [Nitrososphaerota archaeon]